MECISQNRSIGDKLDALNQKFERNSLFIFYLSNGINELYWHFTIWRSFSIFFRANDSWLLVISPVCTLNARITSLCYEWHELLRHWPWSNEPRVDRSCLLWPSYTVTPEAISHIMAAPTNWTSLLCVINEYLENNSSVIILQ